MKLSEISIPLIFLYAFAMKKMMNPSMIIPAMSDNELGEFAKYPLTVTYEATRRKSSIIPPRPERL